MKKPLVKAGKQDTRDLGRPTRAGQHDNNTGPALSQLQIMIQ